MYCHKRAIEFERSKTSAFTVNRGSPGTPSLSVAPNNLRARRRVIAGLQVATLNNSPGRNPKKLPRLRIF